ncbi:MAG: endonuclease/exonuclease/phosphatase family protein [Bdellovibrionales bacterium]
MSSIKIMQLNVHAGALMWTVLKLIADNRPDIICMQEVTSSPEGHVRHYHFLEDLKQRCPDYAHTMFTPQVTMTCVGKTVHEGQLIMSRFPLGDCHTLFLDHGHTPGDTEDPVMRNWQTLLQCARVEAPRPFTILNLHGFVDGGADNRGKDGTPRLENHAQVILDHAAKLGGEIVFCGDTNLLPTSKPMHMLASAWTDLGTQNGLKTSRPAFVTLPAHVCDYIMISKGLKAKSFRAADKPEEYCSDHLALFAEIE